MPKNYSLGKIYKIWSPSTDMIYIGSTCEPTLARRMAGHKNSYRNWQKENGSYVSSFTLLELGDAKIELIEDFPCNSQDELRAREGYHIRNNECVNIHVAGRSREEYFETNKDKILEWRKQYRVDNKTRLNEKSRAYNLENKEHLSERKKERYETDKEKILAQTATYRHQNREAINAQKRIHYHENRERMNQIDRERYVKEGRR